MTEAEWVSSTSPEAMLRFLEQSFDARGHGIEVSDRKLRLFACAACRQVWRLLEDERSRNAVEVAEAFADGLVTDDELDTVGHDAWRVTDKVRIEDDLAGHLAAWASGPTRFLAGTLTNNPLAGNQETIAALLREIVGNPFRPVTLREPAFVLPGGQESRTTVLPSWLTPRVLSIARAAYDLREWDRLPILADALEDAGCEAEEKALVKMESMCLSCGGECVHIGIGRPEAMDCTQCSHVWVRGEHYQIQSPSPILEHLRGPGPHCRGCHVLDLLLGKE